MEKTSGHCNVYTPQFRGSSVLAVIRHLVPDLAGSDSADHNGALVGVGGALFAFGASGHSDSPTLSGKASQNEETLILPKDENPPEITLKDNIIAISSIAPISAETIQEWNLQPSHTVSLKFITALDTTKLAKFFEKQGGPRKGATSSDWASKLVKALGEHGLREAVTVGVHTQIKE